MRRGAQALEVFLRTRWTGRCLDVGAGDGEHSLRIEASAPGRSVTRVSRRLPADIVGEYPHCMLPLRAKGDLYDAIWCCHTLEHQHNPKKFLRCLSHDMRSDALLAVVVPAPRNTLVAGHVNMMSSGLLLLNMVLAGFDCSEAWVQDDGSEVSVVVRNRPALLPQPASPDSEHLLIQLASFFPVAVREGMDGRINADRLPR